MTYYTYNTINQLVTVSMPRSTGTQTRSMVWQGSDLMSTTNPENGTVSHTYDGAHRPLTRTDAKGQQTHYEYDTNGWKKDVRYFDPVYGEQLNQRVDYTYAATGQLLNVQYNNPNPNPLTSATEHFKDEYTYTSSGRIDSKVFTMVALDGRSLQYAAAYQWDIEGKMTSFAQGAGNPHGLFAATTVSYFYDEMGHMKNLKSGTVTDPNTGATTGPTLATATVGIAGELTGVTYQGGSSESRTYNAMLQLTRMTATNSSSQTVMDMQYTFSPTQNNGRITQSIDSVTGETVVYTYDTLNRLTKAETTSAAWGDAYSYDGFGNLTAKTPTKGTAPSMTATFDAATNHQTGQSYDLNGNPLGPIYDMENRMLKPSIATNLQYVYNPFGKRIFKKVQGDLSTTPTTCEAYFYDISGRPTATLQCGYSDQNNTVGTFSWQVTTQDTYFAGHKLGSFTDRLGSLRVNSSGQQVNYFPYGEERTSTPDGTEKFAGYFRDGGGVDYADQRYYASGGGRFLTPDPYVSSGGPGAPSSWNRYAFVHGDPINYRDPRGMYDCPVDTCVDVTDTEDDLGPNQSGRQKAKPAAPRGDGPGSGGGSGTLGNPTAFPECNPGNSAVTEIKAIFIDVNYQGAMSVAKGVQSAMGNTIDTAALAIMFLQWGAEESGFMFNDPRAIIDNNFFGVQQPATGSIPCPQSYVLGATKNACFPASMGFGDQLSLVLSAVPHTQTNPNPGNLSYGDYLRSALSQNGGNPATWLQTIASAGFNTVNTTYGSSIVGGITMFPDITNCLQRNGYIH